MVRIGPIPNERIIDVDTAERIKRMSKAVAVSVDTLDNREKAYAFYAAGMSCAEIGRHLECGGDEVQRWLRDSREKGAWAFRRSAEKIRGILGDNCYIESGRILGAITDEDVAKAGLREKVSAASMLIEKARLLEGKSTENIDVINHEIDSLSEEITTIEAELQKINNLENKGE